MPVLYIPVSGYTGQISSAQTVKVPCNWYLIYWFHVIPVDFCCVFGDRYREVSLYVVSIIQQQVCYKVTRSHHVRTQVPVHVFFGDCDCVVVARQRMQCSRQHQCHQSFPGGCKRKVPQLAPPLLFPIHVRTESGM